MQEPEIPLSMVDSICVQPGLLHENSLDERSRHALWICRRGHAWVITIGKNLVTSLFVNHDGEYEAGYYPFDLDIAPVKRVLYTFEDAVIKCKEIGAWQNNDFQALIDLHERSQTDQDRELYEQYFGVSAAW